MSISDPTLGEITLFAGNFAPRSWAFCSGQLLPIASYTALFSVIGTTYGGDGRTTFALPDLQGRMARHAGNGPGLQPVRLGEKSGREEVTLTVANMPAHNHVATLHGETTVADKRAPGGKMLAGTPAGVSIYADPIARDDQPMAPESITVANAGGGQSFNNMNPFLALNYIIALEGQYPSRS